MRLTILLLLISMLASASVLGTNYYVAPDGDDDENGLTPATAWESIDRGNTLGIVHPGDTVFIYPGTYTPVTQYEFTVSGNSTDPIVYCNSGRGSVIIDGVNVSEYAVVSLNSSYITLSGLTIINSTWDGIWLTGDSCIISDCVIRQAIADGIDIGGNNNGGGRNTILNCIITDCGEDGIEVDYNANDNNIMNNTIAYSHYGIAVAVASGQSLIVNNLIINNDYGISGNSNNVVNNNDIWNNTSGNYVGTVSNIASDVSLDPELLDLPNRNFIPHASSDIIDAGIDIGEPFNGAAPDIGAIEKFNVFYIATDGDDGNDGLTSGTAWATLNRADSQVIPGDTVFIAAGDYASASILSTSGAADDFIHYIGIVDSTVIDGTGEISSVIVSADYIHLYGIDFNNSASANVRIDGSGSLLENCTFTGGTQNGLRIASGTGNTMLNCIFRSNQVSGITVDDDNNRVYNSTFYDSKSTAIDAFSCDLVTITNCLFKGAGSANICIKAKSTATLTYSIFDDFNSILQGGVVFGAGCIESDPLLIDPANGNYRLGSLSPAIDGGTDLGYTYYGDAPDLGAFETKDLASLTIVHSYVSLVADSQYLFSFEAVDADGYPASPGTISWGHTFGSGTIDDTGLFIPQYTGFGTVTLSSDLGFSDATGTLEVVPGALTSLTISPDRDTLTTDETRQFTASGVDSKGNAVATSGTITWAVQGNIGDIDAVGLFTPKKVGVGFIQAYGDNELETITDSIFVTEGVLNYIVVSPQSNSVEEGTTQQFTAAGFDADSNLVGDVTGSVVWSTDDPTGSIDAAGLYTAGTNISPPDYNVIGVYGGSMYDSSTVTVISNGALSYVQIELEDGTIVNDTTLTTDNDSTVLYCRGYDSGDNLLGNSSATWTLTGADGIGSVIIGPDASTTITLHTPGTGQIVATHISGVADSTGTVTCLVGVPAGIEISPDTATINADSTLQYTSTCYDADGNVSSATIVTMWEVIDGVGTINASGLFTPTAVGSGKVAVSGAGLADTTTSVTVVAGSIASFAITPDTATLGVGDSLLLSVLAFDADGNATSAGVLSWQVLGSVGRILSNGLFITDGPGVCSVMVSSNLGSIDISGAITIEALYASSIPTSTYLVKPGQDDIPILAMRLENFYATVKSLSSFTVHDVSRGAGNINDLLLNYDSIGLYYDVDNDSLMTESDSLIAHAAANEQDITISINPPLALNPGDGRSFFVCAHINKIAHDGDSLDHFMYTTTDIITTDGSIIDGVDSMNSLGYAIINGLVAGQIDYATVGETQIVPADTLYAVLAVDIPRNGYFYDTLTAFSVVNEGTATSSDFDSLVLFVDDGDNIWNGSNAELRVGQLINTGSEWNRSGFEVPLLNWRNRFYVAANLSAYPEDGATIALTIAVNGLEMTSDNDGPYDFRPTPLDTLTIATNEALIVDIAELQAREIIPGDTALVTVFSLTNSYASEKAIDSLGITLSFPNGGTDSEEDLLSQIDSLYFYHDVDGVYPGLSAGDTLIGAIALTSTYTVMPFNGLSITGGGGNELIACVVKANLRKAQNNKSIRLGINNQSDVYTDAASVSIETPLYNAIDHRINAFPAEAVTVHPVDGSTLFGGQSDLPVMDFELPRDGYASARLRQISLNNAGTLNELTALASVNLWRDLSNDGYTDDDVLVGSFLYNGGVWTLSGINYLMSGEQTRFSVTVDVTNDQFIGGTLDFVLETGSTRYWSETTGPDDSAIDNGENFLVFPSNRITAISIPAVSSEIRPGSSNNNIFTFALYNGYVLQSQKLKTLTMSNISKSASDLVYTDIELGQIYLYLDADGNRVFNDDSLIATGYFSDGELYLSGLDVTLVPEELSYFFVVNDAPLPCIDSDSLAVSIATPLDFGFENSVNINGDLPLTSGGYAVINGSVHEQYGIIPSPPRTLSPGDNAVTLFTFVPAYNGNQADYLQTVTLANTEDADTSDISSLTLWMDTNNDSLWQAGDSLLGTFTYSGISWQVNLTGLSVDSQIPPLMAVADISPLATPGVAFQASIPVNGCVYASANDGPIDEALIAGSKYTISNSPMRVDFASMASTYSVGQTITLSLNVTNLSGSSIENVGAETINISNPALVIMDSSSVGPVSIAPGTTQEFSVYYTAAGVGNLTWQMRSYSSSVPDSSAVIQTETIYIQSAPVNVPVSITNSMPNSATRGQENIFPLSITISHPESAGEYSALRIDSLMISVVDGNGADIQAADVFSSVILASGYYILSVDSTIPTASTLSMVFIDPVFIEVGKSKTFSLLVSISESAAVGDFALKISDASYLPVTDKNTGYSLTLDPVISFPLQTATCRIDLRSTQMVVASESVHSGTANYGQENLPVLLLRLRHPGEAGSSQIRFTGFGFEVIDNLGMSIVPNEIIDKLRLQYQSVIIGEITGGDLDTYSPELSFNTPIILSAQQTDSARILVSIKQESTHDGFSIRVPDSSVFEVRDLSSGSLLDIATDTLLVSGSAFPMTSSVLTLKNPAVSPGACLASSMPPSVVSGVDALDLIDITLTYPVSSTCSPVLIDQVAVQALDSTGVPLDPNALFDRIGCRVNQGAVNYQAFIRIENGSIMFDVGDYTTTIEPGDSVALVLIGDIESDVPYDNFMLQLSNEQSVSVTDQSDSLHQLGVSAAAGCDLQFPYTTGTTKIFLPAGRPHIAMLTPQTTIAYPGQTNVSLFDGDWMYTNDLPQGDILFERLTGQVYSRTSNGLQALNGSSVFSAVRLYINDALVAIDTVLTGTGLDLSPPEEEIILSLGDELAIDIECDLSDEVGEGNYLISFADSTFLTLTDRNLATAVYPILTETSYPLYSEEISVVSAELGKSISNYPNPFNTSQGEATKISYNLPEDAYVDIEIFTITGEAVKIVADNQFRTAGTHQNDIWNGKNGVGQLVMPGTYFCRITARMTSGKTESHKRKIAVIR